VYSTERKNIDFYFRLNTHTLTYTFKEALIYQNLYIVKIAERELNQNIMGKRIKKRERGIDREIRVPNEKCEKLCANILMRKTKMGSIS
jgi:hypothetical protein